MDDFGDDLATAFPIQFTQVLPGVIDSESDVDYFSLSLTTGQTVSITVNPDRFGDPLEVISLELADETLSFGDVESSLELNDPTNITFVAPQDGTYFVAVTGGFNSTLATPAFATGSYSILFNFSPAFTDLHGDNESIATLVTADASFDATIHNADDFDFFRLDLDEGDMVRVTGQSRGFADPLEIMTAVVIDLQGVEYVTEGALDPEQQIDFTFTAPTTQSYIFSITGSPSITGLPPSTGDYSVNFDFVEAVGPDLTSQITLDTPPVAGSSTLSATLSATNTGTADAQASNYVLWLSQDASIDITDTIVSTGALPALTVGETWTESRTLPVGSDQGDGTFRLLLAVDSGNAIAEADETNNLSATAPFQLVNLGIDDHGDDETSATQLQGGDIINGVIGDGGLDIDAFNFDVAAGDVFNLTIDTPAPDGIAQLGFTLKSGSGETIDIIDTFPRTFEMQVSTADTWMLSLTGNDTVNNALFDGTYQVALDISPQFFDGTSASETLTGSDFENIIDGLGGDDRIDGLGGIDILYGGEGQDRVFGGNDLDTLYGGRREDDLRGGEGADLIYGGLEADLLFGDAGNDQLYGDEGADQILGRDGDDQIFGGANRDNLVGEVGNDVIYGGADFDTLNGGVGMDVLYGGDFPDQMRGGDQDDLLYGEGSNDVQFGDAGNDQIFGGLGKDNQVGGAGNDAIYGGDERDQQAGGTGNDAIYSGDGADRANGEGGNDTIVGGAGQDLIFGGTGNDVLVGGADSDVLLGRDGDDFINGGGDTDKLYGELGRDQLLGLDGNDLIFGGGDIDVAFGGAGNDVIRMGTGADTASGGAGNDNIRGEDGDDVLFGNGAGALPASATDADFLLGEGGHDALYGGEDDDRLDGGLDDDRLYGGTGNDSLTGNLGDDFIFGDAGEDLVRGGAGNDTLSGGAGNDTLIGEAGDDVFLFNAAGDVDRILDFGATDQIQIATADIATPPALQITNLGGREWQVLADGHEILVRAENGLDLNGTNVFYIDGAALI